MSILTNLGSNNDLIYYGLSFRIQNHGQWLIKNKCLNNSGSYLCEPWHYAIYMKHMIARHLFHDFSYNMTFQTYGTLQACKSSQLKIKVICHFSYSPSLEMVSSGISFTTFLEAGGGNFSPFKEFISSNIL